MMPSPADHGQQLLAYLQAWRQHLEQTVGGTTATHHPPAAAWGMPAAPPTPAAAAGVHTPTPPIGYTQQLLAYLQAWRQYLEYAAGQSYPPPDASPPPGQSYPPPVPPTPGPSYPPPLATPPPGPYYPPPVVPPPGQSTRRRTQPRRRDSPTRRRTRGRQPGRRPTGRRADGPA